VTNASKVELYRAVGASSALEFISDFSDQLIAELQVTPEPDQDSTTYVLVANNDYVLTPTPRRQVVTVQTPTPEIVFFNADPQTINEGQSSTLSWRVVGAQQVSVQGPGITSNVQNAEHSLPVQPAVSAEYTLSVNGAPPRPVRVNVIPPTPTPPPPAPVVQRFDVTPLEIVAGESVQLDWEVSGVSVVRIDPLLGGGELPPSGSTSQTLEENTLFVLTASNGNPDEDVRLTREVIVNPAPVKPEILTFAANPTSVTRGQRRSVTLSWEVSGNPANLELTGPDIGTLPLDPTSKEFTVEVGDEALFTLTAYTGDLKDSAIVRISGVDRLLHSPPVQRHHDQPVDLLYWRYLHGDLMTANPR
jgi:hypothetical protein